MHSYDYLELSYKRSWFWWQVRETIKKTDSGVLGWPLVSLVFYQPQTGHGWQFHPGSFWGQQTGPNPTDRAKLGSKRHLICDGRGVPLVIQLTGANRNDSQQALALVDAIPPLQGERGRPHRRPDCVLGDRGYDAEAIRRGLRARRIIALARKAQHRTWQRTGAMAMGSRTDLRLVESVPASARALRKTGGHSRGILVLGVRSDLLALSASRFVGGG